MSFASLPQELRLRILLESVQQPQEDLHQAAILALVSKDCYSIMSPLLWRHLRITTPSRLRRIHAAIDANPALPGLVTQSIHIGPISPLRFKGWPTIVDDNGDGIGVYLRTTLPKAVLPRWVRPGSDFSTHCPGQNDCKHHAVSRAMEQAFDFLDVNPRRRGWSYDEGRLGRRIGIRAWASRLWQAQAALDLYLAEMRVREEDRGYAIEPWEARRPFASWGKSDSRCQLGSCGHYPLLEFASAASSLGEAQGGEQRLCLSKQQLWAHMTRQGSAVDHFDHLLLVSRSRSRDLNMDKWEWELLKYSLGGGWYQPLTDFHGDDDADSIDSDEGDWDDKDVAGLEKAEDLLWLAREVLACTQRVTNLSLTGFLPRAINGLGTPDSLRRLNLGPCPRWWYHFLYELSPGSALDNGNTDCGSDYEAGSESDYGEATMSALAKLRICGMMSSRDARKIATQLPSLRKVVWEWTGRSDYNGEMLGVVQALQGHKGQPTAANGRKWPKRRSEVLLRPTARSKLFAQAPSPGTTVAWSEGRRVSGTLHPVKVRTSHNVDEQERDNGADSDTELDSDGDEKAQVAAEAVTEAQYREGQRWWEQGRVGLGLHSAAGEEG